MKKKPEQPAFDGKNPVAKHLNTFNKPSVERDRKKYHRPSNKKALKSEGFSLIRKQLQCVHRDGML